jgi:integrase/recombinase XerD
MVHHSGSVADLIGLWTQRMTAASRSTNTIGQRIDTVDRFLRRARVNPITATPTDIARFLALPNEHTGQPLAASSRNTYFRDLTAWFRFLVSAGTIPVSPTDGMEKPSQPRSVPRPLPDGALEELIADARGNLLAWLLLGSLEGLRAAEIARFRGEQIEGDILVVLGKGGHAHVLPVHRRVSDVAGIYPRRGWWFPAAGDGTAYPHVWPSSVSRAVASHYRRHGITKGSIHRARHTYGTRLLRSGANIRVVQRLMRHASMQTTAGYLEVTDKEARDAVDRLPDPFDGPRR